jgi:hypothetical protein
VSKYIRSERKLLVGGFPRFDALPAKIGKVSRFLPALQFPKTVEVDAKQQSALSARNNPQLGRALLDLARFSRPSQGRKWRAAAAAN